MDETSTPCPRCILAVVSDPEAVEDVEFCTEHNCERIAVTAFRVVCACRSHNLVVACAGHQQEVFDQLYDHTVEANLIGVG